MSPPLLVRLTVRPSTQNEVSAEKHAKQSRAGRLPHYWRQYRARTRILVGHEAPLDQPSALAKGSEAFGGIRNLVLCVCLVLQGGSHGARQTLGI